MEATVDVSAQHEGKLLTRMLEGQRTFLQNVYGLMRCIEGEMLGRQDWTLLKPAGYGVTRNGGGRGLSNFVSADWVVTQVGIAFIQGTEQRDVPITATPLRKEGIHLLVFQVRWLDKSTDEPVVWAIRLTVKPEGSKEPNKWEDFQNAVFARLEPRASSAGATSTGEIQDGRQSGKGCTVAFSGRYLPVPVTEIKSREDVVLKLIEPALSLWSLSAN